jgi:hypothetical protein
VPSPIAFALLSTRSERSHFEPRRATGYRRGATSTLWLKTSGRSAMTVASGISWPWEVGGEDLDLARRRLAADLPDGRGPDARALVGQVVAVDARHDGVAQPHLRDRAGDAGGLERVVPRRLAGLHVAEAAAARARVAEDHERRRAALPAVADVRAGGLLADRVEVLLLDAALQLEVALAARCGDLEPRRLALAQRPDLAAQHLEHVHPAGVRARARLVLARSVGAHRPESTTRRTPTGATAPALRR